MLNPDSVAAFQKLCLQHERFLIISHVRPDGDAYGSTLGLAFTLPVIHIPPCLVNKKLKKLGFQIPQCVFE